MLILYLRTAALRGRPLTRGSAHHFFLCFVMAAGSEADAVGQARAVLETSVDASARRLAILDAERAALKAERVRVNNCVKNERRKRARLLRKAEGLTVNELFETAVRKSIAIGAAPARRQ